MRRITSFRLVSPPVDKADHELDLHALAEHFSKTGGLHWAIRGIIGVNAEAVHKRFEAFVHKNPQVSSDTNKFPRAFAAAHCPLRYNQRRSALRTDIDYGSDRLFDEPLVDELRYIVGTFAGDK